MFILSIITGVLIVLSAVFLLRKEFLKAVEKQNVFLDQAKIYNHEHLSDLLLEMQKSIDDMNRAFYDIASDLEGKYSLHEKEIKDLTLAFSDVKMRLEEPTPIESPQIKENKECVISDMSKVAVTSDQTSVEELKAFSKESALSSKVLFQKQPLVVEAEGEIEEPILDTEEILDNKTDATPVASKMADEKAKMADEKAKMADEKAKTADEKVIERIHALKSEGLDKRQIARELGIGLGAMELMLKLNQIEL